MAQRYYDEEEQIEVIALSHRSHVARKEHKCSSCTEPINPGERYSVSVYLIDGDLTIQKHHWRTECAL